MKKESVVFDYKNYKLYLRDRLRSERGSQGRLAEALRCHSGYLSQVLGGDAHLSPEQGSEINRFFNHSKNASRYFSLLLQRGRAGTPALKEEIDEQLGEVLQKQRVLKNRFTAHHEITAEDQSLLYSSWHYVAIHLAVLIPSLRTIPALAKHLGLPPARIRESVDALVRMGLIRENGSRLEIGPTHVHLGSDSPVLSKHHVNWRLRAMESLTEPSDLDLHYSSVVTCSREDIPRVREILVRAIEEVRQTIKPSADEVVQCYCLDWFGVGQRS